LSATTHPDVHHLDGQGSNSVGLCRQWKYSMLTIGAQAAPVLTAQRLKVARR
jgi:hypothetical protein